MRRTSLSLVLAGTVAGCAPLAQVPRSTTAIDQSLPEALLLVHNRERRSFGAPPVAWDRDMAASAARYAHELASLGRLQHSSKAFRPGQGENLWMGTRGAYAPATMAESWVSERRHFRPGRFPGVSQTRNWIDIGHFTAMVWPTTNRIGCGLASNRRWDVLVCRYAPAGNVDGVMLAPR